MDTDSFFIHTKTEDFYKDITNNVEKSFDISNYDKDIKKLFPIDKNKKVIGLFKDKFGGKSLIQFFGLRAKAYAYLRNYNTEK